MQEAHINSKKLHLFVQNKRGNYEIGKINSDELKYIETHIDVCDHCKVRYIESIDVFSEIESVRVKKNYNYIVFLTAALVLITLITYLFVFEEKKLNENYFIKLHEFNFRIDRAESGNTEFLNQVIYFINEKEYDKAIDMLEKKHMTMDNLYYFSALILKAQELDDQLLIQKAMANIKEKRFDSWKERARKIIGKK
jgi:tetratricopeptide (TPR) repeat protein